MEGTLKRSISIWQGIALYVGAVIGSGILILPGMTSGIAGVDVLVSWGGMILLSVPLSYTFAFLARQYPSAGGVSTFVGKAFGGTQVHSSAGFTSWLLPLGNLSFR